MNHIFMAVRLLTGSARHLAVAALATASLVAFEANAQFLQEAKPTKFGTGCIERIKSDQTALGACMIGESRSRAWCPNGKVYERKGSLPEMPLLRSVCGLNQVR
jgi:hypothetical protein